MKTKNGLAFEKLRDFLLKIGFREEVEKTRLRYEHPVTNTILLFRFHKPKETVRDRDLLVVRRQLVDNGLIDEDGMDQFLQRSRLRTIASS